MGGDWKIFQKSISGGDDYSVLESTNEGGSNHKEDCFRSF